MTTKAENKPLKKRKKVNYGKAAFGAVKHIIMIVLSLFMIFPVLWTFITSLKPKELINVYPPIFFTKEFSLNNYFIVFQKNLGRYVFNSVIIAVITTLIGLAFAVLAAYGISKKRYNLKNESALVMFIILPMLIPAITNMIPLYSAFSRLGLVNTYQGIILASLPAVLPFSVVLIRNYLLSIPYVLEEAATLDGCTRFQTLYKIIVPILAPGLFAVLLFNFVGVWNIFMIPLIFASKSSMHTLPMTIYSYMGKSNIEYGPISAVSMVNVLPVVALFLFFRKQFFNSLLAGSVKG